MPPRYPFHDFVDTIARNDITAGCGNGQSFCPDASDTRAQMAVFLLKRKLGADYVPPPATGTSSRTSRPATSRPTGSRTSTTAASPAAAIGTPPLPYCPDRAVTRAEMAVFLLKTLLGTDYVPPPPEHIFADVPDGYLSIAWIEDLYNRGITGGCNPTPPRSYCPDSPNTRGQMAVFLTLTFSLQ